LKKAIDYGDEIDNAHNSHLIKISNSFINLLASNFVANITNDMFIYCILCINTSKVKELLQFLY